jgi:hypothetical protein
LIRIVQPSQPIRVSSSSIATANKALEKRNPDKVSAEQRQRSRRHREKELHPSVIRSGFAKTPIKGVSQALIKICPRAAAGGRLIAEASEDELHDLEHLLGRGGETVSDKGDSQPYQ